jgi:hypothetical protein
MIAETYSTLGSRCAPSSSRHCATHPSADANRSQCPRHPGSGGPANRTSRGDGVRFGVSVAQNFQEVDEIGFLLRVELEVADLTIELGRGSCLGGRDSGDVLDVVEDLGRRNERSVAGRRAFPTPFPLHVGA